MATKEYKKTFRIYKTRKTNDGVASQFDFNSTTKLLFLEMSQQSEKRDEQDNALFDWKNKISFKLGITDIGEMLCVLAGRQNGVGLMKDSKNAGLYHKNDNGDSILYFEKARNNNGYYMKLSVRRDGERRQLEQLLNKGEGIVLAILLRKVVEAKYSWD